MARIVVPGGAGYLGAHLVPRLRDRGDEVVVLTRAASHDRDGVRYVQWDGQRTGPWATELDGADAVVHLAGRRVDVRPTRRNVDDLVRSRVESVRAVGDAIRTAASPPGVWVQLATLAIYGEGGDQLIDESVPPSGLGPRQMVTVAMAWEHAFHHASASCERQVLLRSGVAIGPGDPATEQLGRLVRMGLGGRIGTGQQWVSWISLADLLDVILRAIDDRTMHGCYHVCSPNPVRNVDMMAAVRAAFGRRVGLPSPTPATWLGAWALGSDPALALTGRRGAPRRLLDDGFAFQHADLRAALDAAL